MENLQIEYLPINKLKPYPNNPRNNTDAIEAVANSIKEFGFKSPIILDKDNIIVCGHTRYEASKRLRLKEVPVIYADDLTDEQVKAFRLADNKTAELSDWDFDTLDDEINSITDINMSDFGFEILDEADLEIEHERQADIVQGRVENILNLGIGEYEGTGQYDIPILQPVYELPEIKEWIPFNYVLSDKDPEGKAVHFFVDDYQFERLFRNPEKYVEKLSRYVCVATPDFSPYADMPQACQIYNHYRKHWVGAYLQDKGLTVIPTIRASLDERSLEWYLDGEPEGGIVMISSMWTGDEESREYFMTEYNTMFDKLNPCKVFLYGREIEGLRGNIEHLKTFTAKKWGK